MLSAYEQYAAGGGRVMYMGDNGFYWVISFSAEKPWIMEVRRGENGVRAWPGVAGRNLAQHPGREGWHLAQPGPSAAEAIRYRLGLGGYGGSFHCHRMSDGERPEVSWIFAGVRPPDRIGDYGLVGGGASGQ